jgi:hypothetical protein
MHGLPAQSAPVLPHPAARPHSGGAHGRHGSDLRQGRLTPHPGGSCSLQVQGDCGRLCGRAPGGFPPAGDAQALRQPAPRAGHRARRQSRNRLRGALLRRLNLRPCADELASRQRSSPPRRAPCPRRDGSFPRSRPLGPAASLRLHEPFKSGPLLPRPKACALKSTPRLGGDPSRVCL